MRKGLKIIYAVFFFAAAFCVHAQKTTVTVGYYESKNFLEGAAEDLPKRGYAYEYMHKLSSYTGWQYEYKYGSWSYLYQMLLHGELDMLAGVSKTEFRELQMLFPDLEMGKEKYSIYKLDSDSSINYSNPATLEGKKVGVMRDSLLKTKLEEWVKKNGVSLDVVFFADYPAMEKAMLCREIDCLTQSENNVSPESHMVPVARIGESEFYLALAKGRDSLLKELNASLYELDENEPFYLLSLQTKYFESNLMNNNIPVAEDEWVRNHNAIRIGYMKNYLPYCDTLKNGEVTGILKDVTKKLLSQLRLENELELAYTGFESYDLMLEQLTAGNLDVIFPVSGGIYQLEQSGVVQTYPVITAGMCLVFKGGYSDEKSNRIAVNKNNMMQYYYITTYFPNSELVECNSIEDCLYNINSGKADSTILNGLRASSILKNSRYSQFDMIQLSHSDDRCFGVSSDNYGLLKLLNRGLAVVGTDYALSCSYKYSDELYNYSIAEFFKNQAPFILLALLIVSTVIVFLVVQDSRKTKRLLKERDRFKHEFERAKKSVETVNEQIKQKEAMYDVIKRLINCGVWQMFFDSFGNITRFEWGPEVSAMLGYPLDFAPKEATKFWKEIMHPEDFVEQSSLLMDVFTGKMDTHYRREYRLLTKDRGYRWFRAVGDVVWDDNGNSICFFGILMDVTDEKDHYELEQSRNYALAKANKAISAMSSIYIALGAGQWIYHYSQQGVLSGVEWSEKFVSLLGFGASDGFPNVEGAFLKRIHPEDIDRFKFEYARTLDDKSGETTLNVEFRVLTKDNVYRWFHSSGRILRRSDGTPETLYGVFMDIDDRIKNDMALRDALAAAEHANKAKTVFLNNMSHDIRTPMNAIIGFTSLAASHIENGELVKDYLKKISTSSDHLLSLINDVLDMSRIESGTVKIETKPVHIPELIHDIRTIVQPSINEKNLEFHVDTVNIENEDIIADRLRLNQILINIMSNAIKFTKEGSISLKIIQKPMQWLGEDVENIADYEFRIKDTGIGMSKEFQKHIFEPFTREETSTVSGIQGTGLGMAITRNVVSMMDGDITVNSEIGKGTEFVVSLSFPVVEAEEVEENGGIGFRSKPLSLSELRDELASREKNEKLEEENSGDEQFKGKNVLLVEDNELNQEIANEVLTSFGFYVEIADDGDIAVERMRAAVESGESRYDIILMDVQMPRMNGYEATRKIRDLESKYAREIPIIAMTANAFEEDKKAAIRAGMNGHLAKPINVEELILRLKEVLYGAKS